MFFCVSFFSPCSRKKGEFLLFFVSNPVFFFRFFVFFTPCSRKKVVVVDDLSNSVEESLSRVRELTECDDDQLIFRKVRVSSPGVGGGAPLNGMG